MENDDDKLKWVIVGVSALCLIISLIATIFGANGDLREIALIFSGVSALVFGAHVLRK